MNTTAWKNYPASRPKDSDFPIWVMRPGFNGPRAFYRPNGNVTNFNSYQWMPIEMPKTETPVFSFRVKVETSYIVNVAGERPGDLGDTARAFVSNLSAEGLAVVGEVESVEVSHPYLRPQ